MNASDPQDPRSARVTGTIPPQDLEAPGTTRETEPRPDHGESTYEGHGRLTGRAALITGGDSGIGRAVALAFAREGADVAITAMPEEVQDAAEATAAISEAGKRAAHFEGDLRDEDFAASLPGRTLEEFGKLDILVLNAAYQQARDGIDTVSSEEFDRVIRTNLYSQFWTLRAAVPHLQPGASIIITSSVQAAQPSAGLFDYAMTKAAQAALVKALAPELGSKGIRINAVAPGPVWTPLIPSTGWPEHVPEFGKDSPLGRPAQPAELAPAYVLLASDEASYISGAVVPVTGGKPF
ncbi:NAD(P)-dependent dehydrogenase (short-subunit alcohol dehydrogenase family) [Sinomonas atrocyanea]|uniref:SDR family oxidoreductase n=1 Tax=Sinomonas atrocyanea TaxID=37927 RepID=UPI0027841443|nr:SDR family oxidoreductase [Sinomonas atrocyanea]MDQ0260984.1 NAD(P)-dependent dehydrogenase (short-subunit alcohol dehydrogenase family) [Sinomonas atrocyanea]